VFILNARRESFVDQPREGHGLLVRQGTRTLANGHVQTFEMRGRETGALFRGRRVARLQGELHHTPPKRRTGDCRGFTSRPGWELHDNLATIRSPLNIGRNALAELEERGARSPCRTRHMQDHCAPPVCTTRAVELSCYIGYLSEISHLLRQWCPGEDSHRASPKPWIYRGFCLLLERSVYLPCVLVASGPNGGCRWPRNGWGNIRCRGTTGAAPLQLCDDEQRRDETRAHFPHHLRSGGACCGR